ncbi:MAG: 5'-nucleotidase [Parasutterella sp.]
MVTTDAMLDYARPKGAVVALINGGNFRAALPVGKITQGDIDNLLPFKDKVLLRKYTGKQLFEAVEYGVSDVDGIGPRMIQASGLRYTYARYRDAHRVRSVGVQDRTASGSRWSTTRFMLQRSVLSLLQEETTIKLWPAASKFQIRGFSLPMS